MKILETKYFTTTIDSVTFLVQYNNYIKNNKLDTSFVYHYFGIIKGIELDISFEYNNPIIGKKYIDIINSSKFIE